jgi:hypothetical protein
MKSSFYWNQTKQRHVIDVDSVVAGRESDVIPTAVVRRWMGLAGVLSWRRTVNRRKWPRQRPLGS